MIDFAYKTDIGLVRPINEDQGYISRLDSGDIVFMVLDGMGGHSKGDKASKTALSIILDRLQKKNNFRSMLHCKSYIIRSIKKANREVNILGTNHIEFYGMGTTIILGYIRKGKLLICNVGDSRIYDYENELIQLSEDQTYVQFLYKTGKITKEEKKIHPKRNVLMNALGTWPSLIVANKVFNKVPKKLLICSDGLYNLVEDDELMDILSLQVSAETKVQMLIDKANEKGGSDNIAVGILEDVA